MTDKEKVLKAIVWERFYYDVAILSQIVIDTGISKYKTRKILKELIAENLVIPTMRKGGYNELDNRPYPPIKGYGLTQKTIDSDFYKVQRREFAKRDRFGFIGF